MKKTVTKGDQSYYDIVLHIEPADQEKAQQRVISHFQKDLQLSGFRKGHVPLAMVMEHIRPEYIQVGVLEQLINQGLKEVITEHTDVKFIGEPHTIARDEKDGLLIVSLKMDVYPEVEVKNTDWEKQKMKAIDTKISDDDIEQALVQLKKSYADYQPAETLQSTGVAKVSVAYHDAGGETVDTTTIYIGEQEFSSDPLYTKYFVGKKKDEIIEIPYSTKLPQTLHYTKSDAKIKKIVCMCVDIKEVVLPEFNEETLAKLFPDESTVKNEQDLKAYIRKSLEERTFQEGLLKHVDEYLHSLKSSLQVAIPKAMIDQEFDARMKNLHERMGGAERAKQYLEGMGEDKAKVFVDDIKKAVTESLEKFFILQKISELLDLDVDWANQKDLEVEKKLYDVLVHGTVKKSGTGKRSESVQEKPSTSSKENTSSKEKEKKSTTSKTTKKTTSATATTKTKLISKKK